MLDPGYWIRPPTHFCPQMTQITQIHTGKNICVNLRDLRENQLDGSIRRAFTDRLAYRLEASSIQWRGGWVGATAFPTS
jgi:hypothetical protein